jgi:hypothetical protein
MARKKQLVPPHKYFEKQEKKKKKTTTFSFLVTTVQRMSYDQHYPVHQPVGSGKIIRHALSRVDPRELGGFDR